MSSPVYANKKKNIASAMTTFVHVLLGAIFQIPKSQRYGSQVFLQTAAVAVIFAPFITLSACSAEADLSREMVSNYLFRNETNDTQGSQPKPRATASSSVKLTTISTGHVQVNASSASMEIVDGVPSISLRVGSAKTGTVTYSNISVTAEDTSTSNSSVNSTVEITKKTSNERDNENTGKENGHDVFSFLTPTEILSGIPYTDLNHASNGQLEKTESSTFTHEEALNSSVAIKDRVNGHSAVVSVFSVTTSPDKEEFGRTGTSPLGSGYQKSRGNDSFRTTAIYEGNTPYRQTSHQTTPASMQLPTDELVTDLYTNPISNATNVHSVKQKVETSQVAISTSYAEQNSTSQTVNEQDDITPPGCAQCPEKLQEKVYPNESSNTTALVKKGNKTTSELLEARDASLRLDNRTMLPLNRTSESSRVPTPRNTTQKYEVISKRTSNLTATTEALSSDEFLEARDASLRLDNRTMLPLNRTSESSRVPTPRNTTQKYEVISKRTSNLTATTEALSSDEFLEARDASLRLDNRTMLPLNRTSESFRVPTPRNTTQKYEVISKRTSNLTATTEALSSDEFLEARDASLRLDNRTMLPLNRTSESSRVPTPRNTTQKYEVISKRTSNLTATTEALSSDEFLEARDASLRLDNRTMLPLNRTSESFRVPTPRNTTQKYEVISKRTSNLTATTEALSSDEFLEARDASLRLDNRTMLPLNRTSESFRVPTPRNTTQKYEVISKRTSNLTATTEALSSDEFLEARDASLRLDNRTMLPLNRTSESFRVPTPRNTTQKYEVISKRTSNLTATTEALSSDEFLEARDASLRLDNRTMLPLNRTSESFRVPTPRNTTQKYEVISKRTSNLTATTEALSSDEFLEARDASLRLDNRTMLPLNRTSESSRVPTPRNTTQKYEVISKRTSNLTATTEALSSDEFLEARDASLRLDNRTMLPLNRTSESFRVPTPRNTTQKYEVISKRTSNLTATTEALSSDEFLEARDASLRLDNRTMLPLNRTSESFRVPTPRNTTQKYEVISKRTSNLTATTEALSSDEFLEARDASLRLDNRTMLPLNRTSESFRVPTPRNTTQKYEVISKRTSNLTATTEALSSDELLEARDASLRLDNRTMLPLNRTSESFRVPTPRNTTQKYEVISKRTSNLTATTEALSSDEFLEARDASLRLDNRTMLPLNRTSESFRVPTPRNTTQKYEVISKRTSNLTATTEALSSDEFLEARDASLRLDNRTMLPLNRTSESSRVPTPRNTTQKYEVISKRTSNLTATTEALSSENISNSRGKTAHVTIKPTGSMSTKLLLHNDAVKPSDFSRNFTVLHKSYSIQEAISDKKSGSKAPNNSSKELQANGTMEQLIEFTKTGHSSNLGSQMMNADLYETTPSAVEERLPYALLNLSRRLSELGKTELNTYKESTTPSGVNGLHKNELPKYTDNNVPSHVELLQERRNFSQTTKSQEGVQKGVNLLENILASTVENNPLGAKSQTSESAEQPNTYVSNEFLPEKEETTPFGKRSDKDQSLFTETTTNTNDLLKLSTVMGKNFTSHKMKTASGKNFTSNKTKTASFAEFYSSNESRTHFMFESENETTQIGTDLSVFSGLPEETVDLDIPRKNLVPVFAGRNISHLRSAIKDSIFPENKSENFSLPDTPSLSYNQTMSSRTIVPRGLIPSKAERQGNTEALNRSEKNDVSEEQELFLKAKDASSVAENTSVWYSDSKRREDIETHENIRNTSAAEPNAGDAEYSIKRSDVTLATLVDNETFSDAADNRSYPITARYRYTNGASSTPEYWTTHVSVSERVQLPFINNETAHAQEKNTFDVSETIRQENRTTRRTTLMRSVTLSVEEMKRSFPQSNPPDRTSPSIAHEIEKNQITTNELWKESQTEKSSTVYPKYNDRDCDPKVSKCALHSSSVSGLQNSLEGNDVNDQKYVPSSVSPRRVYNISHRSGKETPSPLTKQLSAVTSTTRHGSVKYDQFSIEIQSQEQTRNKNRAESELGKAEQAMNRDKTSQSFSLLLQSVTFRLPQSGSKVNFASTVSNDEFKKAAANDTYPENTHVGTMKTAIKAAGSSGSFHFNEKNLDVEKFSTKARPPAESPDITKTPTTVADAPVVSHVIKQTTFLWQKYVHSYAKGSEVSAGSRYEATFASNANHLSTNSLRRSTAVLYSQPVGHSESDAGSSASKINTPYDAQKLRKSEETGLVKELSQSGRHHETILCQCRKCLIPASDSCHAYYKCKHGKPKRKTCSHGKLFDVHKLKCVRAYKANCSVQAVSSPQPEVQAYGSSINGKCAKGNICADEYEDRLKGDNINTRMKEKEYEYGETTFCSCRKCLLPSRGSCSTYYKCRHGKPKKKKRCSRGKLFDYRRRKCVWAHKASCPYRKFLLRL